MDARGLRVRTVRIRHPPARVEVPAALWACQNFIVWTIVVIIMIIIIIISVTILMKVSTRFRGHARGDDHPHGQVDQLAAGGGERVSPISVFLLTI